MGIGPELPAHLQPRTRSPSPPPDNSPSVAGPQLPPHLAKQLNQQAQSPVATPQPEEESDDDYTPDLPPDLVAVRSTGPVAGPTMPPPGTRLGPSMPPQAGSSRSRSRRETPLSAAYSDDSDDGFGPMPLPAGVSYDDEGESAGARLFREREEREKEKDRIKKENEGKLVRDEWMLVPPENMGLLASMDTTNLKARSFNTSAKMGTADKRKDDGPNLWTETPAERQQRLADEVMGRKRKAEISGAGGGHVVEEDDQTRRKRLRDRQLKEEVERHNNKARAESLYQSHSKAKAAEPQDKQEGNVGIWDRDRDLSVNGRQLDSGKRNDMVRNANTGLGSRFGGSGFL